MRTLLTAVVLLVPMSAYAQEAAPAPAPAPGAELPICQKGVTDRCQQGPVAEARAAAEYKGGGRDNSAGMSERQATGGKKKPAPQPQ